MTARRVAIAGYRTSLLATAALVPTLLVVAVAASGAGHLWGRELLVPATLAALPVAYLVTALLTTPARRAFPQQRAGALPPDVPAVEGRGAPSPRAAGRPTKPAGGAA